MRNQTSRLVPGVGTAAGPRLLAMEGGLEGVELMPKLMPHGAIRQQRTPAPATPRRCPPPNACSGAGHHQQASGMSESMSDNREGTTAGPPSGCLTKHNDETANASAAFPGFPLCVPSPSWQLPRKLVPLTPYPNRLLGKGETPVHIRPCETDHSMAFFPRQLAA